MKRHLVCLVFFLFFVAACAGKEQALQPELTGVAGGPAKKDCAAVFPRGRWQFVHSIDFAMADGSGATVIGVTSLTGDEIACALITVEGLTLFEAVFHPDGSFVVRRAVPPFDGPELAKGLIADIRAIFLPPPGSMTTGKTVDGTTVCRYKAKDGGAVDVLPDRDGCWQIKSYSPERVQTRSVTGQKCKEQGSNLIPDYLQLKKYGRTGYTLNMTLIRADKLP